MASLLDMNNSVSTHSPQTSTSVTRLGQPPHSVSTRAVLTLMVPSAVSAVQDLHPHTSHITVRLLDPGLELHLISHYTRVPGAPRAPLPPSSPHVCKDARQSRLWMNRHRGVPSMASAYHAQPLPQCPGPVPSPLTHFLPFYTVFN